jgi:hypothetical protein
MPVFSNAGIAEAIFASPVTVFAAASRFVEEDGFLAHLWSALGRNQVLLLPIIAFAVACAVRRARRPAVGSVTTESAPPPGMTPAESGMLLHGHIGSREVAATLVDLSVKKYLSITDATPEAGGTQAQHDLRFRLLRPEAEWQNLDPHEKTLLRQAFRDCDRTTFSQLQKLLPEILPAAEEQIGFSLWEKGILRNDPGYPATPRWKIFIYVFSLMGLLNGMIAGKIGLGLPLYDYPGLGFLMIAVTMGIVVWGLQDPANCTRKGAQTQNYLQGLRQFIAAVDADRLQRLERYRFDELLPYAIVFGIEQKWAGRFHQLAVQPLNWAGNEETDSLLGGGRLTILSAYLQPAGSSPS